MSARQVVPYTITQYIAAGCTTLTRDGVLDLIGAGLHSVTGGMPCNGCPELRNRCSAFAKLANAPLHISRAPPACGETVRAEAARLGISINEVRRKRATTQEEGRGT